MFVKRPTKVRIFSLMRSVGSKSGGRIRSRGGPGGLLARALPFSAAVNLVVILLKDNQEAEYCMSLELCVKR